MATKSKKDEFAQTGYVQVTESAANTLTFGGISVFSNILTPKGLLIHEVEYDIVYADMAKLAAAGDGLVFGIGGDDALTSILLSNAAVYDVVRLYRVDFGTAANALFTHFPMKRDFSGLPGGGLLCPADRFYGFIMGDSLASACILTLRFKFTLKDLNAQQYIELAQALRVLT